MFQLSLRLANIADRIKGSNLIADIGTDHAYLPIYAVYHQFCQRAIACDVEDLPVKLAKQNVEKYQLEDAISVRKGDGLSPLLEDEIETIIIAGLGGNRIMEILEKDIIKAKRAKMLVLQAMQSHEKLKQWLIQQKFQIEDETFLTDKKRQYSILQARPI